jgi:tetratricopeptide (TPR) repeat protein
MLELPFDIPKSLVSYAEHFQKEPEKATERLKKQLAKRGPDAVGYFLLAWFYHLRNMPEEAIQKALKARIFAPGSPFLQKLNYYLQHPDLFEAWTPAPSDSDAPDAAGVLDRHEPILDLDTLIQQLSEMKSQRIQPDKEQLEKGSKSNQKVAGDVDNITSETLAKIHEQQGKIDMAIRSYEQLKKAKPKKEKYYQEQIVRLENLKKQSEEE